MVSSKLRTSQKLKRVSNTSLFAGKSNYYYFILFFTCLLIVGLISEVHTNLFYLLPNDTHTTHPDMQLTHNEHNHNYNNYKSIIQWDKMTGLEDMTDECIKLASDKKYKQLLSPSLQHTPFASTLVGHPVYVSLTTIHARIYGISETIESIVYGSLLPDHIFLYVSFEPYLLDEGVTVEYIFKNSPNLQRLIISYPFISIIFTNNIGPHRKLLPLLSQKWKENCIIITIDDHELYLYNTLLSLINYYIATNQSSIIALRSRRIGICTPASVCPSNTHTNTHTTNTHTHTTTTTSATLQQKTSKNAEKPEKMIPEKTVLPEKSDTSESSCYRVSPYTSPTGRGIWPEARYDRQEMLTLPTGMYTIGM